MLYKFKQDHDAMEAMKEICCEESEGAVVYSTVTRLFKKFLLGYKEYKNNQARLGNSKTGFQSHALSHRRQTLRGSGKLNISQSTVVAPPLMTSAKASKDAKLCLKLPNYSKIFYSSK